MVFSLLGLLAGSESLILMSCSYKVVGLVDSRVEILLVGEKLSEVDNVLIEESTSDDWGMLLAVSLEDHLVNGISNELFQLLSLVVTELANVNTLWKRQCAGAHWLLGWLTCTHNSSSWLASWLSNSRHALC